MEKLSQSIRQLLKLISENEHAGRLEEADVAHKALIKLAQQAQGNAYSYFDPSQIPPAISAILANLNYKVTQLDNTQKQLSQQIGGTQNAVKTQQQQQQQQVSPDAQYASQQFQQTNQNPITPTTVNYVQTPGSTPAPIEVDGGDIHV